MVAVRALVSSTKRPLLKPGLHASQNSGNLLLMKRRSIMDASQSRDSQIYKLADGRSLGFAEYGALKGKPLLWFHGFPASRLEAAVLDEFAHKQDIHVISIDRPGFGLSSPQPNRRITDWPSDVQALTAHLGLSKFAVVGGSGGGPYALACAYCLPQDMLSTVGLFSSGGPWEAGIQETGYARYFTHLAATHTPTLMRIGSDALLSPLKWLLATDMVKRRLDEWLDEVQRKAGTTDTRSKDERRANVLGPSLAAFEQGSAAFVEEARLLSNPWGIKFEDIRYDRVQIWHGTNDTNAPIRQIRWLAERVPKCELVEFEDDHYTSGRHIEEVLTKIMSSSSV